MMDIETASRVVAEKIMGWTIWPDNDNLFYMPEGHRHSFNNIDYLRTGNGMLELMEALHKKGFFFSINPCIDDSWGVDFSINMDSSNPVNTVWATTAPDALIMAAAKLVESSDVR